MDAEPKKVELAEFTAHCSEIMDEIGRGLVHGIDVTRDGQVVATVRPAGRSLHHGWMRGTVQIPEGFDLTAPVLDDSMHAEDGREHE